jgi:Fungal Zn(2)-Cys(6) binuclear cluster domain
MLPTQAGQSSMDTMTPQLGQYSAQRETPVRKRRRTINSCAGCRKRKSRCDREQPCGECVANATLEMCQYLESAVKPRNVTASASQNALARLPVPAGPLQTRAEVLKSRELVGQDQDLATRVSQLENILRTQMSLLTQPQSATVQDIRRPTHPNTPPETGRFRFVNSFCR